MTLRPRWLANVLSFYESTTDESSLVAAPVVFYDDFIGATISANYWIVRDTGGANELFTADAASGVYQLALTSTNEIQLGAIDWNNQRSLALNQKPVFEARVRMFTLPTGTAVAVVGLCGDHNAAVNTVAESVWFRWDGSGAITVEHDDTVHETSLIATGVTVTAGQWVTLRIECDIPTAVRFYIDGARVASGTIFNMSQVAALALQPVFRIGKEAASTAVGTMEIDYVRCWQARTA
jgi:hypothetical protein